MTYKVPRLANRLATLVPEVRGMTRASVEAVAAGFIGQGVLIVTGVLLARQLGAQQRGYAALLMLWPVVVSQVGELGLPNASAYFIARDPGSFRHIVDVVRNLAIRQVPVLVFCHAAILAAFLLDKSSEVMGAAFITLVGVPAMMAGDYGLSALQGQQRFRTFNLLRLVNPAVLCPGLLILMALNRTSLIPAMVVVMLALCASGVAFLVAALAFRPPLPVNISSVSGRDLLSFGVHGLLGSTYPVEMFRIDQLAVGLFLSPTALGIYVVGLAFTNLPLFISQSLGYIAYPGVAAEGNVAQRRRIIWRFFWVFSAASLAIVAVLETLVPVLIPWLYGPQFAPSVSIARVALIGGLLLSARRILAESLRGAGHPFAGTLGEATLLAVLLPSIIIGGYYWGPTGVAGAVALGGLTSLLVLLAFEGRTMRDSGKHSAQRDAH
jgi:O-antigen/teichoic acid export membrane protein